MTDKQRIRALERETKQQRALLLVLARAVHMHTRTDLAPDAALPAMRRLVLKISKKEDHHG